MQNILLLEMTMRKKMREVGKAKRTIDHDACLTPSKGEKYKRLSTSASACNSFLRRKGLARQEVLSKT